MPHFKLTLAYDGTAYHGWQVQLEQRTIQGTIEEAILKLTGQSVRVTASGRTDAGVHALGQVASFSAECRFTADEMQTALNAILPDDMVVLAACEVSATFDPIRHARRKRYRYVIQDGRVRDVFARRYCWHITTGRLNVEAMRRAAAPLVGRHDFASFETSGSERATSVRTVFELALERGRGRRGQQGADETANEIVLEIEADGFLYNMVRTIVGTLVEVGRGVQDELWPSRALAACDRRAAGPTAPPQGLFLVYVKYA